MEPERNIEKLLRAYAKKRRAEAGDAFTPHPVTRRRLQTEVAKQFAEPPEAESVSLWQLFRQQWAVLAGFALVIFLVASMFLPALSKAKLKAQGVSAMANLKQIGAAAQIAAVDNNGRLPATLGELTNNHLLSENLLTDPVSGKPFVFAAGGEQLDALASNAVLAYSPENKKNLAVLLADGSVQMMSQKQFGDLEPHRVKVPAATLEIARARREAAGQSQLDGKLGFDRPVPAAAPGVSNAALALNGRGAGNNFALEKTDGAATPAAAAAAQMKQLFRDADRANSEVLGVSNSQRFRNAVANNTPVLASFELQHNGNQLAIVDADGSVYQGALQTSRPVSPSPLPAVTPPRITQRQISVSAQKEGAAATNFSFRVVGQNRTSKQYVIFTGNLISLAGNTVDSQTAATANNSAGSGKMSPAQSAAQFSNLRIAGTAMVDTTNQIEVNAMPTTP